MSSRLVDIFLIYQFIRRLVTPFNQWKAFDLGIIDANGKVLKTRSELTPEQNEAFGLFDVLVLNLKKLLGKIPAGKTVTASYAAAILLLKEQQIPRKELVMNEDLLARELSNQIRLVEEQGMPKSVEKFIREECPANNIGGGHIAGADDNPPMSTKRQKRILRRPKPKTFKEWKTNIEEAKASKERLKQARRYARELVGMHKTKPTAAGKIAGEVYHVPAEKVRPHMHEDFAGHPVFEVDTATFMKCRLGKRKHAHYVDYIGECENGQDIRQYGLNNPGKPIIVQDRQTGAMMYLRYGGKYPIEEALDPCSALAKKIMPSGYKQYGSTFDWSKHGGHAGKNSIFKTIEKAKKLGFQQGEHTPTGSPDGSYMGSGTIYTHPDGHTLKVSSSYGPVAYDNSFSITLRCGGKK